MRSVARCARYAAGNRVVAWLIGPASSVPPERCIRTSHPHRDTHFQFLKDLKANEEIFIQTADKTTVYQVYDTQVVDSKKFKLHPVSDSQTLILVTCYPFDSLDTGGTLRFLVYATAT